MKSEKGQEQTIGPARAATPPNSTRCRRANFARWSAR
jgi:hypothetical protein